MWSVATPFFALLAWLVVRGYRGNRSFLAWNAKRPLQSAAASVLWGGLAAVCAYGAGESAANRNGVDAASFLPWVYLFLCLRSSAVGEVAPPSPLQQGVLLLLVYAEAPDYAAAERVQHHIQKELRARGITAQPTGIRPYWKIPTYYGLNWQIDGNAQTAFDAMVSLAPSGWTFAGDAKEPEAFWNHAENAPPLFTPEVRWAHGQISRTNL